MNAPLRVLVSAFHGVGHVFPMLPLALAFRSAGHDVLLATGGRGLPAAVRSGLPYVDYGTEMDWDEITGRIHRELARRPFDFTTMRNFADVAHRVSLLAACAVDETVRIAESWRPDLIVHDTLNGAGMIAAAKLGVPAVHHMWGFARTAGLAERYHELLRADFDRHGASGLPEPAIVLDVAPPGMLGGPPDGWSLQYLPHNAGPLPGWLLEPVPPRRPRVAVTLGTEIPADDGAGAFRRIVAAAAETEADFVLAVGTDPAALGTLPPNVRAEQWLPFGALLSRCTAVVHHGGSGVTMTALAAGIPQLLLPDAADRFANAAAVTGYGAGLTCAPGDLNAELLTRLTVDDELRLLATQAQTEVRTMPTPAATVTRLEAIVR